MHRVNFSCRKYIGSFALFLNLFLHCFLICREINVSNESMLARQKMITCINIKNILNKLASYFANLADKIFCSNQIRCHI
jgi:hypothetical protein